MRKYYLFKINKTYYNLTRDNPYILYKAIESIYRIKENDFKYFYNYFESMRDTFNKDYLNTNIYEYYKNRHSYTKIRDTHMIYDYYTKEESKLIVNTNYLLIKSTKQIPTFLKAITRKEYVFVCDFDNTDYFWLEELA
jgi:hypothetical protein